MPAQLPGKERNKSLLTALGFLTACLMVLKQDLVGLKLLQGSDSWSTAAFCLDLHELNELPRPTCPSTCHQRIEERRRLVRGAVVSPFRNVGTQGASAGWVGSRAMARAGQVSPWFSRQGGNCALTLWPMCSPLLTSDIRTLQTSCGRPSTLPSSFLPALILFGEQHITPNDQAVSCRQQPFI